MNQSILFKNVRIVDAETDTVGDVLVKDGIIAEIGNVSEAADRVIEGNGKLVVMPSLFDMHVHFRDPGFTHKEDVLTGCAAALAGGVSGVVCMPNTKPPIDSKETVDYIVNKAEPTGVSVYPAGCVTKGMLGKELYDHSSIGVKIISDDGRPVENAELLRQAMLESNKNGILIASHCEDLNIINGGIVNDGEVSAELGLKGMNRASEDSITAREIAVAMSADARIHICHVSTVGSLDFIREAKARGVKVTCETCPHYFMYTDEKIRSLDADYRMNPPLRTEADRAAVEKAVLDGTIDCIVTDHAPHAAEEKADFYKAPNGVVGLETSLAAMLTHFYHTGKLSLSRISEMMAEKPRKLLGLPVTKVEKGAKADLILVDTEKEWIVEPEKLHSKSHNTVFKGEKFKGQNLMTITDGIIRFER
ncbi:MAG: dihydroorotase [Oscillospiraceae bacterium]|nr:dihydroorotase [Oscillospiraceae bacterium]